MATEKKVSNVKNKEYLHPFLGFIFFSPWIWRVVCISMYNEVCSMFKYSWTESVRILRFHFLYVTIDKYQYRQNNKCRLFKIWGFLVHNNLESEAQRSYALASLNYKTKRDHACNYFGLLLQGYTILWSFERQESIRAVFLTTMAAQVFSSSQSCIVQ